MQNSVETKLGNKVELIGNFADKNILIVVEELNDNMILATRNLNNIILLQTNEINTYDVVAADTMIITENAVKQLEEVLGNE